MPPPVEGYREKLGAQGNAMLDQVLECSAIGSPETVERGRAAFLDRTNADEVMLTGGVYDPQKRKRSFALAADAMRSLSKAEPVAAE